MSGGPACTVKGHRHVVVVRNANHSAFNGYRWTWSRYSEVWCVNNPTRGPWRSAAKQVDSLPDATPEDIKTLGVVVVER